MTKEFYDLIDHIKHNRIYSLKIFPTYFRSTLISSVQIDSADSLVYTTVTDNIPIIKTARDFTDLLTALKNNVSLSELEFCDVEITVNRAKLIAELPANKLAKLKITHAKLGDPASQLILDFASNCTRLSKLDLSFNAISENSASYITKMITASTSLKQLNLSWNPLGFNGATSIFKALETNSKINILFLQDIDLHKGEDSFNFTDSERNALADIIAKQNQRAQLSYESNEKINESNQDCNKACIENTFAERLKQMLAKNSSITELRLDINHLEDRKLDFFKLEITEEIKKVVDKKKNLIFVTGIHAENIQESISQNKTIAQDYAKLFVDKNYSEIKDHKKSIELRLPAIKHMGSLLMKVDLDQVDNYFDQIFAKACDAEKTNGKRKDMEEPNLVPPTNYCVDPHGEKIWSNELMNC